MNMADSAAGVYPFTLTCAVAGWQGTDRVILGRSHALLLAFLRCVDPARATALHDANVRKPWALGPLELQRRANGFAELRVTGACWDAGLARTLADGCSAAEQSEPIQVLGHPAQPLSFTMPPPVPLADLVPRSAHSQVAVQFVTPTLFGLGRTLNGAQRVWLLPSPGLVVASWMRAWLQAGGDPLNAQPAPEWWDDRLTVAWVADVQTVGVPAGNIPMVGFVGRAAYAWAGQEPGGAMLLAALATFSQWCGTGAKTGLGFGQTRPIGAGGGTRPRAE